jgi:hypothetical protein
VLWKCATGHCSWPVESCLVGHLSKIFVWNIFEGTSYLK